MYGLLSFAALAKEFLPSPYSEYHFWQFLPKWSVWTWLTILLVILLSAVLEAAYTQNQLSEAQGTHKLIGIEADWTRQRKAVKPSAIIVAIICVVVIAIMWVHTTSAGSSDIHIRQVEIGWEDSAERLIVQETDYAEPGKQWAANVHYTSAVTSEILVVYTGSLIDQIPSDMTARYRIEDQEWDRTLTLLKYPQGPPMQVLANTPRVSKLNGPFLDQKALDNIIDHKAAVYFMAAFAQKNDSEPLAELCIYREGNSPLVHYCHDHNSP